MFTMGYLREDKMNLGSGKDINNIAGGPLPLWKQMKMRSTYPLRAPDKVNQMFYDLDTFPVSPDSLEVSLPVSQSVWPEATVSARLCFWVATLIDGQLTIPAGTGLIDFPTFSTSSSVIFLRREKHLSRLGPGMMYFIAVLLLSTY